MDLLAGSWSGTTDSKPNVWTFEAIRDNFKYVYIKRC